MQLDNATVHESRLASGLRVIVAPQPHLHRAHLALYVRVGSRFETAAENGISHFLEHMLYRGTDELKTAHEVNFAFERIGSYLYGATHADFGVFSVTVPPQSLAEATRLFSHVMQKPEFQDLELEKGIVAEEILEDLDDDGRQVDADNLSRALLYGSHPLGFTITGTEKSVRRFDVPLLRKHHQKHYTGQNAVLCFSGAVDPKEAKALAKRYFAKMPAGDRVPLVAPSPQKRALYRFVENASSQTELRVCFRAVGRTAPERIALELLMRVIDDGMSTRLYHRICDSQGLCYDVSAGYDGYEDDGVVDFAAGVVHERTHRVTREILTLVTELATEGPTKAEVDKAKERHTWHLQGTLDSPEEMAELVGLTALTGHTESAAERVRVVQGITRAELKRAAAMLADPKRLGVVAVGLLDRSEADELERTVKEFAGA